MLPPILCISNMEWDAPLPTNRQQLMRRFAERTEVAVVEAPLPVLGSVAGRSRGRRRNLGWRRDGNVQVLHAWDAIPYPLARRSPALSRAADAAFRGYVAARWRELRRAAPILWLYTSDGGNLLGAVRERATIYHCVDDHDALEPYNRYRRTAVYDPCKREDFLVKAADLVIVTSPRLSQRWSAVNPHTHLLPNVADTALFAA
ncbi:MAG: hypothetical protein ACHQ4H_09850, partial [Ktedonobacterales bacterium]